MSNMTVVRVLVVEDHSALAQNLAEFFDEQNYALDFATDGLSALHLLATQDYDVIVLDVMLPGVGGFELCQRLRRDLHKNTPVIFMTAKDQLLDKEQGFAVGADDYLVKPFALRELQLRINALFKRQQGLLHTDNCQAAGLLYDRNRQLVHNHSGANLSLTGISAKILYQLMQSYPAIVSYEQLVDKVWGEREVDMNTVRTQVYSLRKSLLEAFGYNAIKTLHGRGYVLQALEDDQL